MGMGSGGAMTGASTRAKDVPCHVMSCHVSARHATPCQRGRLARQFSSRRQDAYFNNAPRPVARLVPLLPIILLQRRSHTHFAHADRSAFFFIGALFASLERKRNAHAQGYLIRIAASIHRLPVRSRTLAR